ncbi:MAG TPA: S8 family peptidase, partial [Pseudonocardiaceae bacterium]
QDRAVGLADAAPDRAAGAAGVAQDRTEVAADPPPPAGTDVIVQPGPPSWGLDRIDQRSLPLDLKYHYPNTAGGVKAYIIGTGIRFTHQEFGGRAVRGFDAIGDGQNGNDCQGSGTFIAGIVGGATVGVAKGTQLVSVRVLNCSGSGSYAQVIAGVDWITADAAASTVPTVANMSVGGGAYQPLDDAVTRSIAGNVHYSVAAGGSASDACLFSPARVPRATTVGATTNTDARASFSAIGRCLDVFAPGMTITSTWFTSDTAYNTISGTTPATSHASGVAALWRHRFPSDNADHVAAALAANATPGVVTNAGANSPNLLLFMGMVPR